MRSVVVPLSTATYSDVVSCSTIAGLTKKQGGSVRRVIINSASQSTELITLSDMNGSVSDASPTLTSLVKYAFTGATSAPFEDSLPSEVNYRFTDGLRVAAGTGASGTTVTLVIGD